MDWFERLTGFAEIDYASTKQRLDVIFEERLDVRDDTAQLEPLRSLMAE